jgi:hypothetical protein
LTAATKAATATDIAFQAYPFIGFEFLSRLNQDEICYLDSQSCFRLPVASPWQGMLHAYFEHINPLVPVLDEAGFWRTVRDNGASSTLSLFIVQAILFAACPFASRRTIRECGFANCRKARAAFYRRAKVSLLHNSFVLCILRRLETDKCSNSTASKANFGPSKSSRAPSSSPSVPQPKHPAPSTLSGSASPSSTRVP